MANTRASAVAERAKLVHGQYLKKARKLDRDFNAHSGNLGDPDGPVVCELKRFGRVRGLVFGGFGEWSQDVEDLLHDLIKVIADDVWKEWGFVKFEDCVSVLSNAVVRDLGIESLRLCARLILDRRDSIGSDKHKHVSKTSSDLRRLINERDYRIAERKTVRSVTLRSHRFANNG